MRILVIAATRPEIDPFCGVFNNRKGIDVLVTGVGMVATSYYLVKQLYKDQYDLVINAGIAGAFDRKISLGDVVEVKIDEFSELGVEDEEGFSSVFQMSLIDRNNAPFKEGKLINPNAGLTALNMVNGITVNTVHGNSRAIDRIVSRCKPDVESMEGRSCGIRLSSRTDAIRANPIHIQLCRIKR